MKKILTIAGSDCSGGAGIQADLKTFTALGGYGMSVITTLTAQNTVAVKSMLPVSGEFLEDQLEMIFTDIMPDAVKIGMIPSVKLIQVVANYLKKYEAKNVVLDPVMVAASGANLSDNVSIMALKNYLFPLADLITPNIHEAEVLAEMSIQSENEMVKAAKKISTECACPILCKGGFDYVKAMDLLYANEQVCWFEADYINTTSTHGTGCTLSSAIAVNLARGMPLKDAIKRAKNYVTMAIRHNPHLGHGFGPINHCFNLGEMAERF